MVLHETRTCYCLNCTKGYRKLTLGVQWNMLYFKGTLCNCLILIDFQSRFLKESSSISREKRVITSSFPKTHLWSTKIELEPPGERSQVHQTFKYFKLQLYHLEPSSERSKVMFFIAHFKSCYYFKMQLFHCVQDLETPRKVFMLLI